MQIREDVKKKPVGFITAIVTLSVIVACLCFGFLATLMHNNRNKEAVERTYEQNVYDLGDNLENLEIDLSKLMVSGNGKLTATLLTDVYSRATAAERALSTLPVDFHEAENAAAFLNKVADFGISYQRAIVENRDCSSYASVAESLYDTAQKFNSQVKEYTNAIARHELDIRKITAARPYSYRMQGKAIAHNAIEYPELIYDGPFSDARKDEVYEMLKGQPSVSLKEAEDAALAALPDIGVRQIKSVGKSEGEPLYELALYGDKANAYVQVSEHGGKVIGLNVVRDLGRVLVGEESAKELATAYAQKLDYDVQPIWYLAAGGIAYVNLAPVVDGTVLYTTRGGHGDALHL
nr:germination protein YpeB [Clostridiales bacterium]